MNRSPRAGTRRTRATAAAVAVTAVLAAVGYLWQQHAESSERSAVGYGPAGGGTPFSNPATAVDLAGELGRVSDARVCGVPVPTSASLGPRRGDSGRAAQFAREPGGALIGAMHLLVRVSPLVGPAVFGPTLREQVTGPDGGAFADQVRADYERARQRAGVADGSALCPIYASFRGYRLDAYSADGVTLRLLLQLADPPSTRLAAVLIQMVWRDGDWRLVAPPRGDWTTVRTLVHPSAAAEYTPLPSGR